MLDINNAFSGFAVKDIEAARSFYSETLGLEVEDGPMGLLNLHLTGSTNVLVYPKPDHEPAVFTILNFEVPDIDAAVTALTERGVEFDRYDDFDQDERGIFRGSRNDQGPDIAWFRDPSGNVLSIIGV
ncbi:VOC family protein [Williamsia muralis]|jgi:catechol 2,3-dioxygenase-like lactoylglutathione lyase family enzyme|uniref:Catechol 2,3-dioxygenase-like lactoylglutathione lyase family enzyme n=1 Tax=Williamsia marianensis TaxID=85044 RepID=A0A315SBK1_WILMA|nr:MULTISPECIES: VOC family protein [Williamsia]MDV7133222.1 VOC family protein [Williamsia muralis]PVY30515.1 catechol 2,3-dioxygenase-like lactoylglutathione lyase family enzyme [Williamsia marianensis]RKR93512.1 catechol 2,3-dioxygenase-like lactoylglutathione lyase family enzyme [Williamsia muralis]